MGVAVLVMVRFVKTCSCVCVYCLLSYCDWTDPYETYVSVIEVYHLSDSPAFVSVSCVFEYGSVGGMRRMVWYRIVSNCEISVLFGKSSSR